MIDVANVDYCPWIGNLITCKVAQMSNITSNAELLAENVKRRRKLLGLTQEAFADAAGIDRTYASQIERAIANPSLSVLIRISLSLRISIQELFEC